MTQLSDIQAALANEARRTELRLKINGLKGQIKASAVAMDRISSINSDASVSLQNAQSELSALETGAGPGITDNFGEKSSITQMLELERAAAKSSTIDYVKANPTCSQSEAAQAWDSGALSSHPTFPIVLQPALPFSNLYQAQLVALGYIQSATWENQRAWIVATTKDNIMSI
jgi:hypothetical protein